MGERQLAGDLSEDSLHVVHLDDDAIQLAVVVDATKHARSIRNVHITSVRTLEEFQDIIQKQRVDLALLDFHLGHGISTLSLVRTLARSRNRPVIAMFSQDPNAMVDALEAGADDFILKRADLKDLSLRLCSAYRLARPAVSKNQRSSEFIGRTMQEVAERAHRLAASAVRSIYVIGETGTGKEVVVKCIEDQVPLGTPFIKVNCGAIAPQLLESELFGHRKGSFTGATTDRIGFLEAASGGWVFLDEVANLSLTAQTSLLRAIENQEIRRVGENQVRTINTKFISASNVDLSEMVESKTFRQDLYQRLQETRIQLAPLRDRMDEIPLLLEHFCATEEGGPYHLSPEAKILLKTYDWREGNVRELRNCIRAMTERHIDKLLTPRSIPSDILIRCTPNSGLNDSFGKRQDDYLRVSLPKNLGGAPMVQSFEDMSDALLIELIKAHAKSSGPLSQRQFCSVYDIPRTTLDRRLKVLMASDRITKDDIAKIFSKS